MGMNDARDMNTRSLLSSPGIQTTVAVAWLARGRRSSKSNLVQVFPPDNGRGGLARPRSALQQK